MKVDRAPISGSVTLRAKAEIPPGHRRFLEKVKLRGSFGIGAGIFSKPSTQEGVNELSAGARGEKDSADPETVLTLRGKQCLRRAPRSSPIFLSAFPVQPRACMEPTI